MCEPVAIGTAVDVAFFRAIYRTINIMFNQYPDVVIRRTDSPPLCLPKLNHPIANTANGSR